MLDFINIAVEIRQKYVPYMFLLRKTMGLRPVGHEQSAEINSSKGQCKTGDGIKIVEVLLC